MNEQAGIQNSGISVAEMLDRINDAIISLNVDDVCIYVNPFAQNILEKRGINILGKSIFDVFQGLVNQKFFIELQKSKSEQSNVFLEDYYPPFNKWYHFSIYPSPTGTTLIIKEITNRKKEWNPDFESNKKYQILFEMNPVPMWTVDVESLRYIDVNTAAIKHYGYTREEFLSMRATEIRPPEELQKYLDHVKNTNDQEHYSGVWKHQKKDGSIIFAEIHYHTIEFNNRRVRNVLAIDVTEEIIAKRKLLNSELRFQALLESSEHAIFIADETGNNIEVNSSALILFGYSEVELKGMNIKELFEINGKKPDQWFDNFLKGTTNFSTKQLKCKGDIQIPVEMSGTQLPDGRILGTVRDISERLRNEAEIRKTNERFQYALMATNDGVWEVDLEEWKSWWSDNLFKLLKYEPGSIEMNINFFQSLIHPDDTIRVMSGVVKAFESESPYWSDEFRILRSDGTYGVYYIRGFILRNELGLPVKLIGTLFDLTSIKKYQEDLAESENRLRTIVQTEPECIKLVDRNGIILEMNPAGLEMIEAKNSEQVIGKNVLSLIHDAYKLEYQKFSNLVFDEGRPFKYEFEITTLTGTNRWVESHVVPMRNSSGEIISSLAITRDISIQKNAQQEMSLMNEQLRLLSSHLLKVREEERTKISREIHDELGQQLTSLKIDLSWLRRKLPKEIDQLDSKVENMITLVDDTVKTVRRISTELRPGILDDLGLVAALEWQSQEFQKRTGIHTDFSTSLADDPYEKATATGIFRVYQESLTNIARHSGASNVNSSLIRKHGNIILTISDNGHGIDKKTLKSPKTLGLLGMQERATMMGGNLQIKSNDGTQIVLTVPVQTRNETVLP